MIMDKLGDSLEHLYQSCDRTFSIKTVCMIGIQIVNRVQSLHEEGYLHRDIKPDNFLIGGGDKEEKVGSVIHMIDMGLTKPYKIGGHHIPYKEGKRLTGTPRYASINTHNGIEQSRRDDLESLVYLLLYFLKKRLPWQGLKGRTKAEKYEQIRRKKMMIEPKDLCKGLPEEFINFFVCIRKLQFSARPDYKLLQKLLQLCCSHNQVIIDWRFDWQSSNTVIRASSKQMKGQDDNSSNLVSAGANVEVRENSLEDSGEDGNKQGEQHCTDMVLVPRKNKKLPAMLSGRYRNRFKYDDQDDSNMQMLNNRQPTKQFKPRQQNVNNNYPQSDDNYSPHNEQNNTQPQLIRNQRLSKFKRFDSGDTGTTQLYSYGGGDHPSNALFPTAESNMELKRALNNMETERDTYKRKCYKLESLLNDLQRRNEVLCAQNQSLEEQISRNNQIHRNFNRNQNLRSSNLNNINSNYNNR
eukprot:UN02093